MICAGIDAGSRTIKIVLLDADSVKILAKDITSQGISQEQLVIELFENLLKKNNLKQQDISAIVATGYGRSTVSIADTTVTEITCHASGVFHLRPDARTIIDIGGQDSKLLNLDDNGKVRDFMMNDRCAAGTGCFLEVVAKRLELSIETLGAIAAQSRNPAAISSMCVVFAETEIIGLLAGGAKREDIAAGIQRAIASRIVTMAGSKPASPVIFTGGVALIPSMQTALQNALGQTVSIAPIPQYTGALGAALIADERFNNKKI